MIVATRVFLFLTLAVISTADATPRRACSDKADHERDGAYFDPVGVHIQPGDTVRWVQMRDYSLVAAYHPPIATRCEPGATRPWNSTFCLVNIQPWIHPRAPLYHRGCTTFLSATKPPEW